jgi:hypothetical protein
MKFTGYSGVNAVGLPVGPTAGPTLVVNGETGTARRLDHGFVDELGTRYQVVDAWHVSGEGTAQFLIALDQDGDGCVFVVASADTRMAEDLRAAGLPQRMAFKAVVFTGLPMGLGQCPWVGRQLARMATNGLLPVPVTWTDSDRLCWTLVAKSVGDIAEAQAAREASG